MRKQALHRSRVTHVALGWEVGVGELKSLYPLLSVDLRLRHSPWAIHVHSQLGLGLLRTSDLGNSVATH